MVKLEEHPTVLKHRTAPQTGPQTPLDASELRRIVLAAGADDVGFVDLENPVLAPMDDAAELPDLAERFAVEASHARDLLPGARTFISFVCRMNREPIRSTARSVANLEFHHVGDKVNEVAREVVAALEARGVRASNPAMGFPMEMQRFPERTWVISHKTITVAAGLGRMGIHRNVIHPRFGNFILLGTVVIEATVTETGRPIDFDPCLECKLCVAACPVGAIKPDGEFDFGACYTHNYREFMGGFTEWVENIAGSSNARDYRERVEDSESASMWQSLSFGANYKAAYCMSACPAGDDVIAPFLEDRAGFVRDVVRPLQDKVETVYVRPGSDAEEHAARRFPHKTLRTVGAVLRPTSVDTFLEGMPLTFQRGPAKGLDAVYHFTFRFTFRGAEPRKATVTIRDGRLTVESGHIGGAQLEINADGPTWIGFLRGERSLAWALVTRRIRLRGSPLWLVRFGKCFV